MTIVAALYLDILAVALPADSSVRASSRDRTLEGLQREFRSSRRGLEPHVESYHAADSSALAAGGEAEEPRYSTYVVSPSIVHHGTLSVCHITM